MRSCPAWWRAIAATSSTSAARRAPTRIRAGNVYGATKAFVRQFTLNLRADLVGTNVHATDVEPGLVGGSEFSQVRLGDDEQARKVYEGTDPLTPDDIADTIAWIISRPARRVNINRIELMPTCQGPGPLAIRRHGAMSKSKGRHAAPLDTIRIEDGARFRLADHATGDRERPRPEGGGKRAPTRSGEPARRPAGASLRGERGLAPGGAAGHGHVRQGRHDRACH